MNYKLILSLESECFLQSLSPQATQQLSEEKQDSNENCFSSIESKALVVGK